MIRYRLDELGWWHFEALVQSVLKAELGIGVEAWGGSGDLGRDAYAEGPLEFPARGRRSRGPFIFQAKFVEGANAAGAKPKKALLKALHSETARIENRRESSEWAEPRQYALLTNASATTSTRTAIQEALHAALPKCKVSILDGKDICCLLDAHPELRRSFPEIMGLRDLDQLLREVVNKAVLERSASAIDQARELVPLFVPTQAYYEALAALKKHSFVVLDGPPEMGKTAIAHMLALIQLAEEWQAVDCRFPDDFFSAYDRESPQIFIADDAFGRTEYDPTMGRKWERDIPKMFHKLGPKHWLVWTTRKHILARALKEVDIAGKARQFPDPGEVIVTAQAMSVEEKARILYRHAKAAGMEEELRAIVRSNAVRIVEDSHFTPERIRRLVTDRLPALCVDGQARELSRDEIAAEMREAIRNPTKHMQMAFERLPHGHKWTLISLLECGVQSGRKDVKAIYDAHVGAITDKVFSELIDDLIGSFLREYSPPHFHMLTFLDWIHPSYRDLVIDEMATDLELQAEFLRLASVAGIKIALSVAGGAEGGRELPLVGADGSWKALRGRCVHLARVSEDHDITAILETLTGAYRISEGNGAVRGQVEQLMGCVRETLLDRWESNDEALPPSLLRAYLRFAELTEDSPSIPQLRRSWQEASLLLNDHLENSFCVEADEITEWVAMVKLAYMAESLSSDAEFQRVSAQDFRSLIDAIEAETYVSPELERPEDVEAEAGRYQSIADEMFGLPAIPGVYDFRRREVIDELERRAVEYRQYQVPEEDEEEDEDAALVRREASGNFNVAAFFRDL
ncbi:hypothetical protein HQ560_06120 [bacterium]|nr:hypothetical protein [bacterium]